MHKRIFHIALILIYGLSVNLPKLSAQGSVCAQMQPFCTDSGAAFPASMNTTAGPGNTYGCLLSQPNPAWYYFEISVAGDLEILITNTANVDVDFIVWGPFTDLATAQSQCGSLMAGTDPSDCNGATMTCSNGVPCSPTNPCVTGQGVDCSFDPQSFEVIDIPPAQVGEVYILMITNFSNQPTDIFASKIGGTGETECSIVACRTVDYLDITAGSPYNCNGGTVTLQATPFSGNTPSVDDFITPAFGLVILTDGNASAENTLEFWDGSNGSGNLIGYWAPTNVGGPYLGPVPSSTNWIAYGEYFDPTGSYSLRWCDSNNSGNFGYSVIDFANGNILNTGTFDHSLMNCFVVNVGAPTGTATFSGPGVTDFGNGFGEFDPSGLATGSYDIMYFWDDGDGCSGSFIQTIDVVCNCPPVGFYDITAGSPYDCNDPVVNLMATNNNDTPGFIVPGFDFQIQTDANSSTENTIEFFDGPNGTGNSLGMFPIGTVPNNNLWSIFSEYNLTGIVYSAVWCDLGNDGSFPYTVFDHASGSAITSGTILGSGACTTVDFGPLSGTATFSGPGVTNNGDGTGSFDPASAGDGTHTITYSWDDGQGCSGSGSQQVQVAGCISCMADAGTFTTPNGLIICFGEDLLIQSNNDYAGSFETGTTTDMFLADGALGMGFDGIPDADGDGINGVVYALYNNIPGPYILDEQGNGNLFSIIGSEPSNLFGNGSFTNTLGGNSQFWLTTSYAFDEDLAASGMAIVGFDTDGNGISDCFHSNQADAVQVTFLDSISAPFTQTCNPFGSNIDIQFTISGGLPGFDGSNFTVTGDGPGGTVANSGTYMISGHPPASAFSISVSDNNGCQAVFSGMSMSPPTYSINTSDISCGGSNDGSATAIISGGTLPFSYLWNNGATTSSITGLGAGTYFVTISDAGSCMGTASGLISEPPPLTLSLSPVDLTCAGAGDGTITANPGGGTPIYTFLWSDGQTGQTASSLSGGNYQITLTDSNACTTTASATINEPPPIVVMVNVQNASCLGNCDGQAMALASGGAGGYSYAWDNGEMGTNAFLLCPGSHLITVTDQSGCSQTSTFQIDAPAPFNPGNIFSTPVSCAGGNDGSATIAPSGGTTPYTFTWMDAFGNTLLSEMGNSSTLSGLTAGTYSVAVTDDNACQIPPINISVGEPAQPLSLNLAGSDPACNNGMDGFISANASGGTPSYNFQWDAAAGGQNTQTAFNLSAGTYQVTATDANGCTEVASLSLSEPGPIFFTVSTEGNLCFGDANGSITVDTAFGGTGPYVFSIDGNNFTTSTFFGGLAAGIYDVFVQDASGCENSNSIVVTEPTEITVDAGPDAEIELGDSSQISTNVNVFDPSLLTYFWNPPIGLSCIDCPAPVARPFETTTYLVQVTDTTGCTASDEITIIVDKNRHIFIPNVFSPNGDGVNDEFMLFGGIGVSNIRLFRVFDRWGEILFQAENYQPGNPGFGWDGRLKGKLLNPGVFVYYAEVEFVDGLVIAYKGDVTLVR